MSTPKNGKIMNYNDKVIQWISPEHCMVLVGYDENNYIFNDPLTDKNICYSRNLSEAAYCGLGMQAVVISGEYIENHTSGNWITVVEPTEITEGIKQRYCINCNKLLEEETIDKLIFYGDINGDCTLNALDVAQFRIILVGDNIDYKSFIVCDFNIDGEIDLKDFVSLKKKLIE